MNCPHFSSEATLRWPGVYTEVEAGRHCVKWRPAAKRSRAVVRVVAVEEAGELAVAHVGLVLLDHDRVLDPLTVTRGQEVVDGGGEEAAVASELLDQVAGVLGALDRVLLAAGVPADGDLELRGRGHDRLLRSCSCWADGTILQAGEPCVQPAGEDLSAVRGLQPAEQVRRRDQVRGELALPLDHAVVPHHKPATGGVHRGADLVAEAVPQGRSGGDVGGTRGGGLVDTGGDHDLLHSSCSCLLVPAYQSGRPVYRPATPGFSRRSAPAGR